MMAYCRMQTVLLLCELWCCSLAYGEVTHSFTEPDETIEVAVAEAGIVRRIEVKQGARVEPGAVLAALDTEVLEATRALAQIRAESVAAIDAAKVDVKLKKTQMDKLALVLASGHASTNEIERASAEYEAALAQLKMAEEQSVEHRLELEQIDAQIQRRIVTSPAGGVVVKVHRRVGEYLSSAEPTVVTLVRLEQLRVKFYVTTENADTLSVGEQVPIRIVGVGETQATVDFISPVTDADSGTVRIELLIDNAAGTLRSGLPCQLLRTISGAVRDNLTLAP